MSQITNNYKIDFTYINEKQQKQFCFTYETNNLVDPVVPHCFYFT